MMRSANDSFVLCAAAALAALLIAALRDPGVQIGADPLGEINVGVKNGGPDAHLEEPGMKQAHTDRRMMNIGKRQNHEQHVHTLHS